MARHFETQKNRRYDTGGKMISEEVVEVDITEEVNERTLDDRLRAHLVKSAERIDEMTRDDEADPGDLAKLDVLITAKIAEKDAAQLVLDAAVGPARAEARTVVRALAAELDLLRMRKRHTRDLIELSRSNSALIRLSLRLLDDIDDI